MKTFEYDILTFPMSRKTGEFEMKNVLNARGAEGWEVVSFTSSEYANVGYTVFLKREMTAAEAKA